VDAFRVAQGDRDIEKGALVDTKTEFVFTKGIELVCESIPGCILQCYAYLKIKDARSSQALVSICISALAAGMSSATIAYNYDVDPVKRKETPDFYGYTPDGLPRTIIFLCLWLNSALLLLMRSFSAALLALVSKSYFLYFLVGDISLYLGYKLARGDFLHWLPVDGVVGGFLSCALRIFEKVATDYTGLVQTRASGALGGIYWSASMAVAILTCFAAIVVYFRETEKEDVVFEESTAWRAAGSLSGCWAVVFVAFLVCMKAEYRGSFFSWETGNDWAMSFFLKGDTDAKRIKPLRLNKKKWQKIRGEVKEWVLETWEEWEEEQPKWFTEEWKKKVDKDMRGDLVNVAGAGGKNGGKKSRRKSSELLAGAGSAGSLSAVSPLGGGGGV
jgi:hypothetical protein